MNYEYFAINSSPFEKDAGCIHALFCINTGHDYRYTFGIRICK